jgi:hypothetical protein
MRVPLSSEGSSDRRNAHLLRLGIDDWTGIVDAYKVYERR